jgi:hypothetical protein
MVSKMFSTRLVPVARLLAVVFIGYGTVKG